MSRLRIVTGSLVGALVVHVVFWACNPQPESRLGDGGIRDASAQGSADCGCDRSSSFFLALSSESGNIVIRPDYSSVLVSSVPALLNNRPGFNLGVLATFFDTAGIRYQFACQGTAGTDRQPIGSAACTTTVTSAEQTGTSSYQGSTALAIATLEENRIEIRFNEARLSKMSGAGPTSLVFRSAVFRTSDAGARFLTPPTAFRP